MDRRKALTVAATITGVLAAASAAMAVNLGLLGSQSSDVGKLDARNVASLTEAQATSTTDPPTDVTVVYQDIPVAGGTSSGGSGGSSGGFSSPAPAAAPASPAPAPAVSHDDDSYEDHEFEDHEDEDHEDEHEEEEHDD